MDVQRGLEMEDDLFFADLTKRISLLITEDEEEFQVQYPAGVLQGYPHIRQPFIASNHPLLYESAHRRGTKGTGVFIPRSSPPKRKNRSGRPRQGERARAATSPLSSTGTTTTTSTKLT